MIRSNSRAKLKRNLSVSKYLSIGVDIDSQQECETKKSMEYPGYLQSHKYTYLCWNLLFLILLLEWLCMAMFEMFTEYTIYGHCCLLLFNVSRVALVCDIVFRFVYLCRNGLIGDKKQICSSFVADAIAISSPYPVLRLISIVNVVRVVRRIYSILTIDVYMSFKRTRRLLGESKRTFPKIARIRCVLASLSAIWVAIFVVGPMTYKCFFQCEKHYREFTFKMSQVINTPRDVALSTYTEEDRSKIHELYHSEHLQRPFFLSSRSKGDENMAALVDKMSTILHKDQTFDFDITLCTQLDVDMIPTLRTVHRRWQGPMSIAFYIRNSTYPRKEITKIRTWWEELQTLSHSTYSIDIHLVFANASIPKARAGFPSNTLREIATRYVNTDYVLYIDVDFIPSQNLRNIARRTIKENELTRSIRKFVLVIPIYTTTEINDVGVEEAALTKASLLRYELQGRVRPYAGSLDTKDTLEESNSHRRTKYKEFRTVKSGVYPTTYEDGYEPYFVGAIDWLPSYDESLRGASKDKYAHLWAVNQTGTTFLVLADGFLLHLQHPKRMQTWNEGLSPAEVYARNNKLFDYVVVPHIMASKLSSSDDEVFARAVEARRAARKSYNSNERIRAHAHRQLSDAKTWSEKVDAHMGLQTLMKDGIMDSKFVIVEVNKDSGLGNRFLTVISAYILAIFSHRALVVKWPSGSDKRIHKNSKESISMLRLSDLMDLQLPGVLDVEDLTSWSSGWTPEPPQRLYTKEQGSYKCDPMALPAIDDDMDDFETVLRIGSVQKWKALACGHVNDHFLRTYITIPESWDFFAPLLLSNPLYNNEIRKLHEASVQEISGAFLTRFARKNPETFATMFLANSLLKPRAKLFKIISDYVSVHFEHRFVVGIHIRRTAMNGIGLYDDDEILPSYRSCANNVVDEYNVNDLPVYYYLAFDSPSVMDSYVRHFPEDRVLLSPSVTSFGRDSRGGLENAIIDLWLLSEADQMIQSDASTFSQFSAALRGLPAHLVTTDGHCKKDYRRVPCYYDWVRTAEGQKCNVDEYLQPADTQDQDSEIFLAMSGQGACQSMGYSRINCRRFYGFGKPGSSSPSELNIPWSFRSIFELRHRISAREIMNSLGLDKII